MEKRYDLKQYWVMFSCLHPAASLVGFFQQTIWDAILGKQANDAFIFASFHIEFYISLGKAKDRTSGARLALIHLYASPSNFWAIYNQNDHRTSIWAERHTDREDSPLTQKLLKKSTPQRSLHAKTRTEIRPYFVLVKDTSTIEKLDSIIYLAKRKGCRYNEDYLNHGQGNKVIRHQKLYCDGYVIFYNVPKDKPKGKSVKRRSEFFQSINPLVMV